MGLLWTYLGIIIISEGNAFGHSPHFLDLGVHVQVIKSKSPIRFTQFWHHMALILICNCPWINRVREKPSPTSSQAESTPG